MERQRWRWQTKGLTLTMTCWWTVAHTISNITSDNTHIRIHHLLLWLPPRFLLFITGYWASPGSPSLQHRSLSGDWLASPLTWCAVTTWLFLFKNKRKRLNQGKHVLQLVQLHPHLDKIRLIISFIPRPYFYQDNASASRSKMVWLHMLGIFNVHMGAVWILWDSLHRKSTLQEKSLAAQWRSAVHWAQH